MKLMADKLVQGSGPIDSKLWIIGDAPREQEVEEGTPFVGYSGKLLRDKIGKNHESYRYENLIGVRPSGNKFPLFESTPENQMLLDNSVDELKARIKEFKPNIVLCVGAHPLKYLAGLTNTSEWRGHVLWSDELNCKIMGTYHPSTCVRQAHTKDGHPGQYEALFGMDVLKAIQEADYPELKQDEYETLVNPSYIQAKDALEDMIQNAKRISYDIEVITLKRNFYTVLIDCIGFAATRDKAICIPLWINAGEGKIIRYWKSESEFVEIFRLIKELLESEIPKVAQNSQYDTVILKYYYDIHVNNIVWDTMVAAHDIYADLPKDLGTLISIYTNIPYQKYLVRTGTLVDRWEYNATDALANIHVMDGEIVEAKELGVFEHYLNIPHAALKPLVDMQITGVRVDEKLRQDSIDREKYILEDIILALDEAIPDKINTAKKYSHKVNPGSYKDKQKLFYDILQCKKVYGKTRALTTDKNAMKVWKEDKRSYVSILATAFTVYQKAATNLSGLQVPLLNGRMHTAYGIGGKDQDDKEIGTGTGRLNSKESLLQVLDIETNTWTRAGTNLQNRSSGLHRQMLITEEGEEFCIVDLWAAEAYLTAMDAMEVKLLDMLNKGIKIHQWMLDRTIEKFGDKIIAYGYNYKKAKITIHGTNYNAQPQILSKETGLPVYITQWQYNMYHSEFPGIKLRHLRIEEELRSNGRTLTSFLGRKKMFLAPWGQPLLQDAYAWKPQSTIGELAIVAMNKLYWLGHVKRPGIAWTFPILNTHDGLVIRVKLGTRKKVRESVEDAFEVKLVKGNLNIKIPVEIGWANNVNDITDTEIIRYDPQD